MVAANEDKREYIERDRAMEWRGTERNKGERTDCDFMTLEVGRGIKFVT